MVVAEYQVRGRVALLYKILGDDQAPAAHLHALAGSGGPGVPLGLLEHGSEVDLVRPGQAVVGALDGPVHEGVARQSGLGRAGAHSHRAVDGEDPDGARLAVHQSAGIGGGAFPDVQQHPERSPGPALVGAPLHDQIDVVGRIARLFHPGVAERQQRPAGGGQQHRDAKLGNAVLTGDEDVGLFEEAGSRRAGVRRGGPRRAGWSAKHRRRQQTVGKGCLHG